MTASELASLSRWKLRCLFLPVVISGCETALVSMRLDSYNIM